MIIIDYALRASNERTGIRPIISNIIHRRHRENTFTTVTTTLFFFFQLGEKQPNLHVNLVYGGYCHQKYLKNNTFLSVVLLYILTQEIQLTHKN